VSRKPSESVGFSTLGVKRGKLALVLGVERRDLAHFFVDGREPGRDFHKPRLDRLRVPAEVHEPLEHGEPGVQKFRALHGNDGPARLQLRELNLDFGLPRLDLGRGARIGLHVPLRRGIGSESCQRQHGRDDQLGMRHGPPFLKKNLGNSLYDPFFT
jgi:hypothetical protein